MATTFSLKQGETRISHGPIPHPLRAPKWVQCLFLFLSPPPFFFFFLRERERERENVYVNCKIESLLCSLDNLLLKHVIVFVFGNHISKCVHLNIGLFLIYFSHFLVIREKVQKFLQHISHLHTYTYFTHPIDCFTFPILQKLQIYHAWFLFGVTPGVDSFSRHF